MARQGRAALMLQTILSTFIVFTKSLSYMYVHLEQDVLGCTVLWLESVLLSYDIQGMFGVGTKCLVGRKLQCLVGTSCIWV